jgi:hypothetical protein
MRMQTRITAADENGYDFDVYEWPWTKIDIPDRTVQKIC